VKTKVTCPLCGITLGYQEGNSFYEDFLACERLYVSCSLIIACHNCGIVMLDPAKVKIKDYRQSSPSPKTDPPKD
jgi:ribosomal protein S27E